MAKETSSKKVLEVWPLVKAALKILTKEERRHALCLLALIIFAGGLDMVALLMVIPLITVISEPGLLEQQPLLNWFKEWVDISGVSDFLMVAAIGVVCFMVGATALNLVLMRMGHQFGVSIQTRLSGELMLATLKAPYDWHIQQNSAVLLRFFHSDVELWGTGFVLRFIQMSQHFLGAFFPIVLFWVLSPTWALFGLFILCIVSITVVKTVKPLLSRAGNANKELAKKLMFQANNAISGIKDVKLAGCEQVLATNFSNQFGLRAQSNATLNFWPVAQNNLVLLLGQLAILGLAVSFYYMGLSHGQIAGNMALIVLIVSRILPAANRFLGLYSSMYSVWPWVEEVVNVRSDLASVSSAVGYDKPTICGDWERIEFNSVSFHYSKQSRKALDSVKFKFVRGGFYGVVGESGAGKSTLIDLLVGLYEPVTGKLMVDEQDLWKSDVRSWQRQIGYVPQFPYMLDGTVEANIAFGRVSKEVDYEQIWQALALANIDEFVRNLQEGLETQVGDRGVRLSGGQRQRLAIARALYQNPQILVLDEATSSLDQIAEDEIRKALKKLRSKITVVMIAHRITTVQECDELLFLVEGRLKASGSYEDLMDSYPEFRRLAGARCEEEGESK